MKTINQAWEAATAEGLAYFWATMHVGHKIAFVGHSWEEGGFVTNENGVPMRDSRGNTVAAFAVEQLDASNSDHVEQVQEWYGN